VKIVLDGNFLNYGGTVLNRVEVAEADTANGMVIMKSGHQYFLEPSVVRGWFSDIMDAKNVAQMVTDCNQPVTDCHGLNAAKMCKTLKAASVRLCEAAESKTSGDDVVYLVGCMLSVAKMCDDAVSATQGEQKEEGAKE
jgi:hypothetical protein